MPCWTPVLAHPAANRHYEDEADRDVDEQRRIPAEGLRERAAGECSGSAGRAHDDAAQAHEAAVDDVFRHERRGEALYAWECGELVVAEALVGSQVGGDDTQEEVGVAEEPLRRDDLGTSRTWWVCGTDLEPDSR
jgi:hypothetical protein